MDTEKEILVNVEVMMGDRFTWGCYIENIKEKSIEITLWYLFSFFKTSIILPSHQTIDLN